MNTKSPGQLELEAQFMAELNALLEKYGAEITAEDHYQGYPECGEDVRVTVSAYAKWDGNGNIVQHGLDIDLRGSIGEMKS